MQLSALVLLTILAASRCQVREVLIVHGGAEYVPNSRVNGTLEGIKNAALLGFKVLRESGSALNAVEEAVKYLENNEFFNAANGSMLNMDGEVEMDASIMLGGNLSTGAVTVMKNVANPISVARLILEKNPHSLLAGEGAQRFAKEQGVPTLEQGKLVSNYSSDSFKYAMKCGQATKDAFKGKGEGGGVGAVALDYRGKTAAASSTGSCLFKTPGRSSSASIIGASTYADDGIGAVSASGEGKGSDKFFLARAIVDDMKSGNCPMMATRKYLAILKETLNVNAGAVTVGYDGELDVNFTSPMMPWAYQVKDELHFGLKPGEHQIEKLPPVKRKTK